MGTLPYSLEVFFADLILDTEQESMSIQGHCDLGPFSEAPERSPWLVPQGGAAGEKAPMRPSRDVCSGLQLRVVPFRRLWSCGPWSVLAVRRLGPVLPLPQRFLVYAEAQRISSSLLSQRCCDSTMAAAGKEQRATSPSFGEEFIHSFLPLFYDISWVS